MYLSPDVFICHVGQTRQEKHTDSYRRQDNHARVCEKRKSERRPNGSTLIIAVAQDKDAGKYKCSLTLRDDVQEVEHTVIVRGENNFSLCNSS